MEDNTARASTKSINADDGSNLSRSSQRVEGKSLEGILNDPQLKDRILYYSINQFSEENILFLDEYNNIFGLKDTKDERLIRSLINQTNDLFSKYFKNGAEFELNVPVQIKKSVLLRWVEIDHKKTSVADLLGIFSEAHAHVAELVQTSVVKPFVKESKAFISSLLKSIPETQKKVVIVGGGFAGVSIANILQQSPRFCCILIDKKPSFEWTPLVIQAMANPDWVPRVNYDFSKLMTSGKFIQGTVQKMTDKTVLVNGSEIPYDYLIIATGSSYRSNVKSNFISSTFRERMLELNFQKLQAAKDILIVGGGFVGVELAAEFKEVYPTKEVTIVDANNRLMKGYSVKTSAKFENYLRKKNVKIILNERVLGFNTEQNCYETEKSQLKADAVYFATGIKPNSELVATYDPLLLDNRGYIRTNLDLTMEGHKNIFVGGDVKSLPEAKLARIGIVDAFLICRNIINAELKKPYIRRGAEGSLELMKTPMAFVTLGPGHGALVLDASGCCCAKSGEFLFFSSFFGTFKCGMVADYFKVLDGKANYGPYYGKPPNIKDLEKLPK